MTEFVALAMAEAGIPPLILTRGYAGGDEAKVLHRHLVQTSAKLAVGANRRAIATSVLERYRHMDSSLMFYHLSSTHRYELGCEKEKVGVLWMMECRFIMVFWISTTTSGQLEMEDGKLTCTR